jgi:hypothetical protein
MQIHFVYCDQFFVISFMLYPDFVASIHKIKTNYIQLGGVLNLENYLNDIEVS